MRLLLFNISQAIDSIRSNLLRAIFTIIIIGIGITAIVGVLTSIDGVKYWLSNSLSSLGSNTFRVVDYGSEVRTRGGGKRIRYPEIKFDQAMDFKEGFQELGIVSITTMNFQERTSVISYQDKKTNNNIQFMGADENYLLTAQYKLAEGRGLNQQDLDLQRKVVVIGHEIKDMLFPYQSPVGKKVNINGAYFTIVGLFEEVGSVGSMGGDKISITPLTTIRAVFPAERNYSISVYIDDPNQLGYTMSEATGIFRLIRKLKPKDDNNFSVILSTAFVEQLMDNLQILTLSATAIASITLLGASISLLNIMLISVTERTREIGVRKAMGATKRNVMMQFLVEAIVICQIGGLFGVFLGILAGNVLSTLLLESGFVIPWLWMFLGLTACLIVGVLSGIYPAWKAAKVDPIESLRYE